MKRLNWLHLERANRAFLMPSLNSELISHPCPDFVGDLAGCTNSFSSRHPSCVTEYSLSSSHLLLHVLPVFSPLWPSSLCFSCLECPVFSSVSFMKPFLADTSLSCCLINQWLHSTYPSSVKYQASLSRYSKSEDRPGLCYHGDEILYLLNLPHFTYSALIAGAFIHCLFFIILILKQLQMYRKVKLYKWYTYIFYTETPF